MQGRGEQRNGLLERRWGRDQEGHSSKEYWAKKGSESKRKRGKETRSEKRDGHSLNVVLKNLCALLLSIVPHGL